MSVNGLTLKQSMSKNIQAIMPQEEDKIVFEKYLLEFLKNLQTKPNESEEFQKNLLKDFLQKCLPKNFINTIGRTDLAVYNGPSPDSSAGILIESKSLSNKSEMISKEKYNTKAFQEIIHYYMNERWVHNNIEVKKCIVTNGLEWFVFESKEIEKHFVQNKHFRDMYDKWRLGQLANTNTDFLYHKVISPAIDQAIESGLKLSRFDLRDALKQGEKVEIKKNNLTQLYRFFTPENLLNKEIFTDSNKLNKGFYDELLYLMGLEEVKTDNKKVIQRLPSHKRQLGSFVENIIDRLHMNDVPKKQQYETAVQLTVVWINRILFLKLLESQLVAFNREEKYKFINRDLLPTFDDIYYLFFGVLAKKFHQRTNEMKDKFPHIPYLNSSLFEESELEQSRDGISIDRLREHDIQYYSKTVLTDKDGKRKTGTVSFLSYLYNFLDTYDFSTSVKHNKDDKNNLINASVLGLIFEKINGYNEGSYYTPGRITMYMSKNAIREAVVEKINEIKGWNCKNIYDVQFKIGSLEDAKEINEIINTLKICDPAVGSGHFLVSVLNELIAIKSELGVLVDTAGHSLNSAIRCTVVNDELVIQDFNGDNFKYRRGNQDSERIQKTIFHEKRKLIENCLFGVDINPNSAHICRLRLWIELLKSSYYYQEKNSDTQQLITLPNIDINIKVGNSLLHKFEIKDKLDKRFSRLKKYTQLVSEYKETNNKRQKQEIVEKIKEIKQNFLSSIVTPEAKVVTKLRDDLADVGQVNFLDSKEEKLRKRREFEKIENKLKQAIKAYDESRKNPLFSTGFEWRMEFPEVLDEKGNFVGFDVVIANPPYIYSSAGVFDEFEKRFFAKRYPLCSYQANTYGLFLELSLKILRKNGYTSMIIPNTFLTNGQYNSLRQHLLKNTGDLFMLNSQDTIFEDASVDNCIVSSKNTSPTMVQLAELKNDDVMLVNKVSPKDLLKYNVINISAFKENKNTNNASATTIIDTIEKNSKNLEPTYGIVRDGLKVYQKGKGEPKQPLDDETFKKLKKEKEWYSDYKVDDSYWEIIKGKHIDRYKTLKGENYIHYGRHLAEPRTPDMFMGERLLIRQIPRKNEYTLTVSYTDKPVMHERSLISIRNLKIHPYFALGVLNSKIESYYAIHKNDFLQRKTFPQLRLYQIKELPIPNTTPEQQIHLVNLVQELIESFKESDNEEEIKSLNNSIDEYVMDLYSLEEREKQTIRDFAIE